MLNIRSTHAVLTLQGDNTVLKNMSIQTKVPFALLSFSLYLFAKNCSDSGIFCFSFDLFMCKIAIDDEMVWFYCV